MNAEDKAQAPAGGGGSGEAGGVQDSCGHRGLLALNPPQSPPSATIYPPSSYRTPFRPMPKTSQVRTWEAEEGGGGGSRGHVSLLELKLPLGLPSLQLHFGLLPLQLHASFLSLYCTCSDAHGV